MISNRHCDVRNTSYRTINKGCCHACACASVQGVASKGGGHSLCLYPAPSPTHGEPSVHFYFNILSISQISSAICSIISFNALLQFKLVYVFFSFYFLIFNEHDGFSPGARTRVTSTPVYTYVPFHLQLLPQGNHYPDR